MSFNIEIEQTMNCFGKVDQPDDTSMMKLNLGHL